jgi:hypothetical protein
MVIRENADEKKIGERNLHFPPGSFVSFVIDTLSLTRDGWRSGRLLRCLFHWRRREGKGVGSAENNQRCGDLHPGNRLGAEWIGRLTIGNLGRAIVVPPAHYRMTMSQLH